MSNTLKRYDTGPEEKVVLSPLPDYRAKAMGNGHGKWPLIRLECSSILRPKQLDIRKERDPGLIDEYREKYHELDKAVVFYVEELGGYALADGWNRDEAASLKCIVAEDYHDAGRGTLADAVKLAIKLNTKHGQRLTRDDWVKISFQTHKMLCDLNHEQTQRQTAEFLGLNFATFNTYLRKPDGVYTESRPHGIGHHKRSTFFIKGTPVETALKRFRSSIDAAVKSIEKVSVEHPVSGWSKKDKESLKMYAEKVVKLAGEVAGKAGG